MMKNNTTYRLNTVTTWLFSSITERISSGPDCRYAPVASAMCLYLAAQCFMGILL